MADKKKSAEKEVASDLAKATEDAAAGQTDSQKEMREYHEGEFQTHDPITGEERDLDERIQPARVDRGETVESTIRKPK